MMCKICSNIVRDIVTRTHIFKNMSSSYTPKILSKKYDKLICFKSAEAKIVDTNILFKMVKRGINCSIVISVSPQ